jgi:hypothetical protein
MTHLESKWQPASADVVWEEPDNYLDGEKWPKEIIVRAWERNDEGERRISATKRYVKVEDDDDAR